MFENNAKKITVLDGKLSGAMKVFNDTLADLRKSLEGYCDIRDSVQEEINTLEATKAEVSGKIESTNTLVKRFEDFLAC